MKKILNSIYHDTTKYYVSNPYPKKGEEIEIKIRLLKNEKITAIYLRYIKLGAEHIEKMSFDYEKNGLVYYKIKIECLDDIVSYSFNFLTKDQIYYYGQHQITDFLVDETANFKIITNYKHASWMAKSVFYQILPDRFYNGDDSLTPTKDSYEYRGDRPIKMKWGEVPYEYSESKCMDFYGGDLYGVIEKIDYLKDLGVNAIYLNPIFTSPTMHKYDALDYFEIDPSLGGEEALIELSNKLHENEMKLMLDISVNHTSSSSKWFNMDGAFYDKSIGAYNNPDSKERDYYFIGEDGSYECWAGVKTMPSLNYSNQAVRDIIYNLDDSVLKKWIKPPFNIDGWRFDVADVMGRNRKVDVYNEIWSEINSNIKKIKPNAVLLAEQWNHTPEMYHGDKWDSTMNYFGSARPIREFAGEIDLFSRRIEELALVKHSFNAVQLKERIIRPLQTISGQIQYQMLNLINSHDVTRLHNNPQVNTETYKGAIITLFALPGASCIYYGDEKYLDGRMTSIEGARYSMDWSDELPKEKEDIYNIYRKMANLKSADACFEFGGFKVIYAKGDIFAITRFTEDQCYIMIWNKSEKDEKIQIDLEEFGLNSSFEQIIGNANITIKEYAMDISLNRRESIVVKVS